MQAKANYTSPMPPVQAIIAKELRSYFVSPIVYVVGAVFLLTFGFLAYLYIVFTGAQAIQLMQMQVGTAQINLNDLVFRKVVTELARAEGAATNREPATASASTTSTNSPAASTNATDKVIVKVDADGIAGRIAVLDASASN